MKSLFKTVSLITIFSIITRILGFLFRIFIGRILGAEDLGVYQISFSIFMVLLTFVSSGLPLIISRTTAKAVTQKDKALEQKTLTAGFVISVIASIVLCVLVLAISPILKNTLSDPRWVEILIILLPALVFSSVYSSLRGNMWGKDDFLSVCITELFEQVVRIGTFILLSKLILEKVGGSKISAISMTISCVLSAILCTIIFFAKGGRFKKVKDKKIYKNLFRQTAPITGVRLATSLITPLIALIIPARLIASGYTSSQALSLYGIASGMTVPLLFIPSTLIGSLSMALVPDLSSALAKNDTLHISKRITTSCKFTIFISALFVPLYMGAGEYIGRFFYDNAQSGILLCEASWIMIPLGLTNITSSILNAVGLETKQFKNYIVGGICMLLCIWFLPALIGIRALIYGFGICFVLSSILNIAMLKKHISKDIKIKRDLLVQLLLIIPSASICSFLCNILTHYVNLFFNLAITCTISTIFYFVLCLVFNVINYKTFWCEIKKRAKIKLPKKRKHKTS